MIISKLLAIHITRRTVAVVLFEGLRLDYTQERHLSSERQAAENTAAAFVRWVIAHFPVQSVALERPNVSESRHAALCRIVLQIVRENALSLWEVNKQEILNSFGVPALTTRKELRTIAASFWPILTTGHTSDPVLDAAALGLHVSTLRLFLK